MSDDQTMLPFEGDSRLIRRQWVNDRWYFSVVDVVAILTDSPAPRQYWGNLKQRIQDEGFTELLSKCLQLKLRSLDGKRYATDAADTETLLRIVQSIPSPKAEPFKQWLAKVGAERLEEVSQSDILAGLTPEQKAIFLRGQMADLHPRRAGPRLRRGDSAALNICAILRMHGFVIACSVDQAPHAVGPGRPVRRQRSGVPQA